MPTLESSRGHTASRGTAWPLAALVLATAIAAAVGGCEEPENGPFEIRLDAMGMDGNITRTGAFSASSNHYLSLAVAPDGEGVVAVTADDAGFLDGNLVLRKHLRSEKTGEHLLLPAFSPDGRQVAFLSSLNNRAPEGGVAFFNARGANLGRLSTGMLLLPGGYSSLMAQTFEPVKSRTINAEYSGLAGHSLAVVVRVSVKVEYEYPGAREWVTRAIAAKLEDQETRDSIRGLKVVQADVVLKYQEEHLRWDEMDRAQLGKALGADFVLLVNLTEFRTREPASLYRLQGLMTADVSLYKTDLPERESRVFKCDDIRVINPKDTPGGPRGTVDSEIIREMIKEFAEKVVWKFYRHEEPAEG